MHSATTHLGCKAQTRPHGKRSTVAVTSTAAEDNVRNTYKHTAAISMARVATPGRLWRAMPQAGGVIAVGATVAPPPPLSYAVGATVTPRLQIHTSRSTAQRQPPSSRLRSLHCARASVAACHDPRKKERQRATVLRPDKAAWAGERASGRAAHKHRRAKGNAGCRVLSGPWRRRAGLVFASQGCASLEGVWWLSLT